MNDAGQLPRNGGCLMGEFVGSVGLVGRVLKMPDPPHVGCRPSLRYHCPVEISLHSMGGTQQVGPDSPPDDGEGGGRRGTGCGSGAQPAAPPAPSPTPDAPSRQRSCRRKSVTIYEESQSGHSASLSLPCLIVAY